MYEDDGIRECHQEIRRLRGVVREQYEEIERLKSKHFDPSSFTLSRIEIFDNIKTEGDWAEVTEKYSPILVRRYFDSIERNNGIIDFHDLSHFDVIDICNSCRALGIERIAVSADFSGMTTMLCHFLDQGCRVAGTTRVNTLLTEWRSDKPATVPALVLEL